MYTFLIWRLFIQIPGTVKFDKMSCCLVTKKIAFPVREKHFFVQVLKTLKEYLNFKGA